MRKLSILTLLVFLLAWPALADGPETGVVSGTVTDGSGSALPGVSVTLKGDRGEKFVQTGADGGFRFIGVVPGAYTVKAVLEGLGEADGIANVSAGGQQTIELKLRPTTAEEITVTSEAPMVDKYNVTAGATIKAEEAGEISATVRSFYGALQVLPGVTNDAESADLSQSRPTVNGALWQESNVYVDGVDATYSMRGGGTRVFLPSSALTEVSMEAGGGGAEYGRNVGSHTNLIVKSGTNRFHGDVAAVYNQQSWNANYDPQPDLARDQRLVNTFIDRGATQAEAEVIAANWIVWQPGERSGTDTNIEASFGGPIKRDKAWFFLSRGEVSTNGIDKTLDGQQFNVSSELFSDIVKLNFQPGVNHSLAYTYINAPVDRIFLLPPMGDRYNATFFDLSGDVNSLSWNWSVNQNLFIEAKVAQQVSDENRRRPFTPEQKALDPNYLPDPALGRFAPNNNDNAFVQNFDNTWHNGWIFGDGYGLNEFPRSQFNTAFTQFAGANHELKYGLDFQTVEWNQSVQRPNTQTAYDFQLGTLYGAANNCLGMASDPSENGDDTRCFLVDYNSHGLPKSKADSQGDNYGLYIRDRINIGDHWTFNVGLRGEQQTLSNDTGREVIDQFTVSPRFNGVYDVKGDGRQLFSLNLGRFFVQTPQYLVNANLLEGWNGASNTYDLLLHVGGVDSLRPFVQAGLPPEVACTFLPAAIRDDTQGPYCLRLGSVRPGQFFNLLDQGLFTSDIEPYHRDEIVLGYEWQFSDNWAFDAKGIYWQVDNLIGSSLQRDPNFGLYQLVANYEDYADILRSTGFVDNFLVGNQNVTFNGQPATREMAEGILNSFEDDHRNYKAIQLQLNRRFKNNWALYNNVSISKVRGRTYGGGNGGNDLGAFNNLNDDYGRNMEAVLSDQILATFAATPNFCADNFLPASCIDDLRDNIGQPLSTINRFGELPIQRDIIYKTYGYKVFNWGKHNFNLGGLFLWQSGSPWQKTNSASNPNVSLLDNARNTSINLYLTERASFENNDAWQVNLTGAWTFPITSRINGRLRGEVTNLTDEQGQIATSDRTGLPLRSRRSFQQPRKMRILASIRF